MTQSEEQNLEPLVLNLGEETKPTVIESLCMGCGKNGETVLLLTKIPFFKDTLIGSFSCDSCGHRNNEVQFIGQLPSKGISIIFKPKVVSDLDREVIKSEHATINFQGLGLEIPATGRAEVNTVEGILSRVESNLQDGQEQRKLANYEAYIKIQQFIIKIQEYKSGKHLPMTITLVDPSGKSNIKNPFAPKLDDRLFITFFTRTKQQIIAMGYSEENALEELKNKQAEQIVEENQIKTLDLSKPVTEEDFMHHEPSIIQVPCHSCLMPGEMKLCQTNIPHFRDLIIMSFACDYCGAHSTDTKTSGIITDKSTTITLNVTGAADVKRDLYKSQSCSVKIPEIELELDYGTLGGSYTTVEGLLDKIKGHMRDLNPFTDSDDNFSTRIRQIIKKIEEMMTGALEFTLILEDPLSNSFLQNPFHPAEDKNAKIVVRQRTEDELDFLGINDMCV